MADERRAVTARQLGVGVGAEGRESLRLLAESASGLLIPSFRGGRVDVTKRIGASVGAFSDETVTQEERID
ncbi:MAG: hypothetical protein U0X92_15700 [Anaerolineales bacterium]